MDTRLAEIMYQQWIQGNDDYYSNLHEFVKLAEQEFNISGDQILRVLQTQWWWEWHE
jgi:hypothetical protein